jgi:tRNA pseudouridine38-40 synthase
VSAPTSLPFGVLLRVAYDGRAFSGFARQTNARGVAEAIEAATRTIDPDATALRAVSRTDAGVHARDQVVAFDTAKDIRPRGWVLAINQYLDDSVAVVGAARVEPGHDPRRTAVRKTYRYLLLERPVRDPLWSGRAWRVPERLNHDRVREALNLVVGTHDFAAFRTAQDRRTDTVRTIFRAALEPHRVDRFVSTIEVEGNRFMHRMVRIIVGSVVDVGRAKLDAHALTRAFSSRDRGDLGMTAPHDGLYLHRVELKDSGEDKWPDHSY